MKKILKNKPQAKGIITKIITMAPKKPNSAIRKVALVKVANIIIPCYIPGIGHNLTIHSVILLKGGKTKDLSGLNYKIIRGTLDCNGVNRKSSRSKYGCKKDK